MNTKDIQWFREICNQKSMTKASKELFVSQQALSKCIKNLEQQLDVTLLIRTASGVEPTRCGWLLYERTEGMLKEWEDLVMELQSLAHIEKGYLRLCSAYGVLRILSPDFLFAFENQNPGTAIDYMEYPDLHVDKEMTQGNFDVAFHVEGEQLPGLVSVPMFSSRISLLVYKGHPLAQRETVSVTDLKDEPMIIESGAFYINHFFRKECARRGIEPNIIFNTSGFSLCHQLCRQKRGLSLVVDRISNDMNRTDLVRIPFEENMQWNVSMIYRREFESFEIINQFRTHVEDWIRNHVTI